jgi:hypothetical protein
MVLALSKTCPLVTARSGLLSRRKVLFSKVKPLLESQLNLDLAFVATRLLMVKYRPAVDRLTATVVTLEAKHFTFGKFILAAVQSYTQAVWELRSIEVELYSRRFLTSNFGLLVE